MKAITKSWTILKHGGTSLESSPLAIKLATRYAKSYYYAREPSRVKVHEDIKYTEEDDKAIDDWISGMEHHRNAIKSWLISP